MVKFPVTSLAELENTPKQILCILSLDEDILPWSALIAESRRDGCAFNAQFHRIIEKLGNILRCFPLKEGTVHGNPEPFRHCDLYGFNRPVKNTILANRGIVPLFQTIQMNGESQKRGWGVIVDLLLQQ